MLKDTRIEASPIEKWFDELISGLRAHQLQLETGIASSELLSIYNKLIGGNSDQVVHLSKNLSQQYFVGKIIYEYLQLLKDKKPRKLAFDFDDSEVLVWAEIEDNDEAFEKELILIEAKINAKYHQYGYDMSTTIVEISDQLSIPNHYRVFKA